MAEAALFSIGCKILSTVASPVFKKAYEKGRSIKEARDELDKLTVSIKTIQDVLFDAEKKKEGSAAIRNWIERVKDVLYDADDLFDEVATDEMLKQQIKGDKPLKKVRAYCFKLNPIVSRNSIANQVKAIRNALAEISNDMAQFNFVAYVDKQPISEPRKENNSGSYVDSKNVIGRDDDKKVILEMLSNDKSNNGENDVAIIAIVGIGGMGKTTLAQLVYNDKEVEDRFEKRWFACISDSSEDREVIGKIFQSVCDQKSYNDVTFDKLQTDIRKTVKDKKFLLVLDDVWDDDHGKWIHRMSLLTDSAKGSKIIVTTRSISVAKAVGALEAQTHNLEGLLESESWDLFKRVALNLEQEKDPRWTNLGKEILKKCSNVPLAIRSVGSLLYTKDTIEEWESFKDNELSKVELSGDSIMRTLKLSYDHLPFHLRPCFAYCSHLPKDYVFNMEDLIYLWIAQGYVKPIHEMQTVEQVSYSYFMDLNRRSFFERAKYWDGISTNEYKMHDLIHDLAQCVAGEEIIVLTKPTSQFNKRARHVTIGDEVDTSRMLNSDRLRSLMFLPREVEGEDRQIFTYGKCLRALSLSSLRIHSVSSCIGELKHLRYLDLSYNEFESLPDSLTNLLNLLTLNLNWCDNLKALPNSFRKLIKLRHLHILGCNDLKHMPPGMEELTCLQNLNVFKVGKAIKGVQSSGLDVLAGLQLRGKLEITFEEGIHGWHEDECWKLPIYLEVLEIKRYPGSRIPNWSNHPSLLPNLSSLSLLWCRKVKYLPPLRCLPNLKYLCLADLEELEYIEEDNGCSIVAAGFINNNASFFRLLEDLDLRNLPQLKGWSRMKVEATPIATSSGSPSPDLFLSFPRLSILSILKCGELTSFPLCPCIRKLKIYDVDGGLMQHLLSESLEELSINMWKKGLVNFPDKAFPDLLKLDIYKCQSLENFRLLASPLLEELGISGCAWLTSFEVEALPSLGSLYISRCERLESLHIAHLNALKKLVMWGFSEELELDVWGIQQEEKWCNVDWDSLPNICEISVHGVPKEPPDCLRRRQDLGQLSIKPRVWTA